MASEKRWAHAVSAFTLLMLLCAAAAPPAASTVPDKAPVPGIRISNDAPQVTAFYFGANALITPLTPFNETGAQQMNALGVTFPRALISNVGRWTVTLVEEGMVLNSLNGISIWAGSDTGAQNVRFIIQVEVNGNQIASLSTETKAALAAQPSEFRIDPGSTNFRGTEVPKGSQLAFNLQYASTSSHGPIGPSSDSTFYYYGNLYRSRVEFVTSPFNLSVVNATVEGGTVNATTIVKEAFGLDPNEKVYTLLFSGPTSSQAHHIKVVNTITDPINGTTLYWNWDYRAQGVASSGAYTITLSGQYVNSEINYSNISTIDLKFPPGPEVGAPGFESAWALGAVLFVAMATAVWRRLEGPSGGATPEERVARVEGRKPKD